MNGDNPARVRKRTCNLEGDDDDASVGDIGGDNEDDGEEEDVGDMEEMDDAVGDNDATEEVVVVETVVVSSVVGGFLRRCAIMVGGGWWVTQSDRRHTHQVGWWNTDFVDGGVLTTVIELCVCCVL